MCCDTEGVIGRVGMREHSMDGAEQVGNQIVVTCVETDWVNWTN